MINTVLSQAAPRQSVLQPERLLQLHARLQRMLVNVELGLLLLYFTASSASAVDCATLRDAMERHAALSHHVLAFRCFCCCANLVGRPTLLDYYVKTTNLIY